MKNILIFAGTIEGRRLSEMLGGLECRVTVCVATEYGAQLMTAAPDNTEILTGRLDCEAMEELMSRGDFLLCADATHPYAAEVSKNILASAEKCALPVIRILRQETEINGCVYVSSAAEAARYLIHTEGGVLLTTGAKELNEFTCVPNYQERLYPRVLPSVDSVKRCSELGYADKRIIAMQGPFSRELNEAMLRQFGIKYMVTKDSGKAGGFEDKIKAAENCGCTLVVIRRPLKESGMDVDDAFRHIAEAVENSK